MQDGPEMPGDPHEGLFVAEIPFFGGGYFTIPSANPEDPFILELLIEGVFRSGRTYSVEFSNAVHDLLQFGLYVSHQCLTRAGLSRQSEPGDSESDEICWPGMDSAIRLQQAVTFDRQLTITEMANRNTGRRGIDELVFDVGSVSSKYSTPLANPTLKRPIVSLGNEFIVVAPTNLLSSMRDAVIRIATEHGVLQDLMNSVNVAGWLVLRQSLEDHKWLMIDYRKSPSLDELDVGVFQFDDDKVAVVHLIVDKFESGCVSPENEHWELKPQLGRLQESAKAIELEMLEDEGVNEVLQLVVIQGLGRFHMYSPPKISNSTAPVFCASLDELRVSSQIFGGDALGLWQLAKSKQSSHKAGKSVFGGFLDQLAKFRERSSFYYGDAGLPDLIIMLGPGRNIRLEAQSLRDPHIVRMPMDARYGRVFRLQNLREFPIYTVDPDSDGPIRLLVEGLPIPFWIVSPIEGGTQSGQTRILYYHLADMIAFWVWQLTPTISDLCGQSSDLPQEVVVGIHAVSPETFFDSDLADDGHWFAISEVENVIRVEFESSFGIAASDSNNRAERAIAKHLLLSMAKVLKLELSDESLAVAINHHAPLGLKRRMKTLNEFDSLMLDNTGLPQVREVQAFEAERIRDEVGEIVESMAEVDQPISTKEAHELHTHIAKQMFDRWKNEIDRYNDAEILPIIVSRHESLISELRRTESIIGTHLAAMGNNAENRDELQNDQIELNRANTASRFLLEYIAACPPQGTRLFSTASYDRLLAIASEIVESGFLSDSLFYEVADIELSRTPSQRLRYGKSIYTDAVETLRRKFYERKADRAISPFEDEQNDLDENAAKIDELANAAAVDEFGFSLIDIQKIGYAIGCSPFMKPYGVGFADYNELIEFLGKGCSFERSKIQAYLAMLIVEPRADYWKPPKPYSKSDVFPWKFNRSLSYLRKPLIRRDRKLYWGRRSTIQAASYLCDLVTSGRLQSPKSESMITLVGRISDHRGKAFNRELARSVAKMKRYSVRASLTTFNGKSLVRRNNDPIGDVDVSVVDRLSHTFFPVEAKSFAMAKTPSEVKNEFDGLFKDAKDGRKCAVNRHQERVEWLRDHIVDVLAEFGITENEKDTWRIEPILVLDTDLLSRYLTEPPFPIMSEQEFIHFLESRQ